MDDRDELEMELDAPNDNEWDDVSFSKRMDKVASASQNLGSLLLQGWTMLAEECPQCHTPLMSLRGAEPRCVMCKPVESASNSLFNPKSDTVVVPRPNKAQSTSKTSKLMKVDELRDTNPRLDHSFRDFGQKMEKTQDSSARIGELLLKGWTMLAQHCDKCQSPLMSLRGGDPMCCICDTPKKIVLQNKTQTTKDKAKISTSNVKASTIKKDHPTGMNGFHEDEDVNNGNKVSNEEDYPYLKRDSYDIHGPPPPQDYGYSGYHEAPSHHGPQSFDPYHQGPPSSFHEPPGHHPAPRRGPLHGPPPHGPFRGRGRGRGRGFGRGRGRGCRGRGRGLHHGFGHRPPHYGHPPYGHPGYGPPPHVAPRHPGPLFFGFGRHEDAQLERSLDGIVTTVISKMNACHERMKVKRGNVSAEMQELNQMVEFLHTVQKLKHHGVH